MLMCVRESARARVCVCVCVRERSPYLTKVHADCHVLYKDMRKEALTFDLIFIKCEGNSEMDTISSKRNTWRRGFQVLCGRVYV